MAVSIDGWTRFSINFVGDGSPAQIKHKGFNASGDLDGGPFGLASNGVTPVNLNPRGVLIMAVNSTLGTDGITTVQVGPSVLGPWTDCGRVRFASDTVGEPGTAHAYFLGSDVPAGTLWLQIAGTGNLARSFIIVTFNAASNTAVAASGLLSEDQTNPSIALNSGSDVTLRLSAIHSGQQPVETGIVAAAGITQLDRRALVANTIADFSYQTTPSSGSFSMAFTAALDDCAMVAVAIRENFFAAAPDPDPSSLGAESTYFKAAKDSVSRARAFAAKMRLTECQNAYANAVRQWLKSTDEFNSADWGKTGGATIDVDVAPGPDALASTADRISFAAAADFIEQTGTGSVVTSKTFVGSVWLFSAGAAGTVELTLSNAATTESAVLVCNVTSVWQRFSIQKQFSGVPVDAVKLRIGRGTGGLTEVIAWRANVTQNPANDNQLILFPTVRRQQESVDTVSVMAGRCQAADAGVGKRCSYSGPTCQDPVDFNTGNTYEATAALQGYREMFFSSCDTPLPVAGETFYAMIESAQFAAQEIYPDKSVTINGDVRMQLLDDTPKDNWNALQKQRGFLTNTNIPTGTFWRRFRTIYRNFANPRNTFVIYESFPGAGAKLTDLAIRGTYLIHNMILTKNIMELELIDRLKLLHTQAPAKISDSNTAQQALTAGNTTFKVRDVTQVTPLPDPASPYQYPVVLQLDSEGTPEFVNVVAVDTTTNTFTIQRGRWGTAAASHPYGFKWREALCLGTENTTPSQTPRGINPFDAMLQLLHRGFGSLASVSVTTFESMRDTYLPGGVSGNQNFGTVFRRAGGVVGQANAAIVDPTDIEVLLRGLRESAQVEIWVNKDQIITCRKAGPLNPTTALVELTDTSDIIADSATVDENEITRCTRVTVAYGLVTDKDGTDIRDYANYITVINADAERIGFDGEDRVKVVLSPWILASDSTTATTLALQIAARYFNNIRKLRMAVELRNDYLQVGSTVAITTDEIQDSQGTGVTKRQFYILRRAPSTDSNRLELLLQDEDLLRRFGWISPDAVVQYDSATDAQKRYAFIADSFGLVGTTSRAPGYYIWPV